MYAHCCFPRVYISFPFGIRALAVIYVLHLDKVNNAYKVADTA